MGVNYQQKFFLKVNYSFKSLLEFLFVFIKCLWCQWKLNYDYLSEQRNDLRVDDMFKVFGMALQKSKLSIQTLPVNETAVPMIKQLK